MQKFRIIDAHAHIFPTKIVEKAVKSIGDFYDLKMNSSGTADRLLESGSKIGVEKYLVCSTATKPAQVQPINDFIYEECKKHKEFIGFATLHPYMENLEQEIERILQRGYKGIKLHPDFQEFSIDDEVAMKMYALLEGKLTILFHTGDKRYSFSNPKRLQRVCERFPDLKCIAAHFGGYSEWEEAFDCYESENIYMDTSSSLFALDKKDVYRFLEKFGVERFFFGTDFPMWQHEDELKRFFALGLDDEAMKKIFFDNFNNAVMGGEL